LTIQRLVLYYYIDLEVKFATPLGTANHYAKLLSARRTALDRLIAS